MLIQPFEAQYLCLNVHSAVPPSLPPSLPPDFLSDVRSLKLRNDPDVPVLVHCSAGVGRSGVVVLVDMLMAKVDCGDVSV